MTFFSDVEAATEYSYQMEEKDQMNGYSEFSETVKVCTGPPEVLNFDYTLDSTLKVTFTWNIPLPNTLYEKAIAAQITTNYLAQGKVWYKLISIAIDNRHHEGI